jgi:hypothetical protein
MATTGEEATIASTTASSSSSSSWFIHLMILFKRKWKIIITSSTVFIILYLIGNSRRRNIADERGILSSVCSMDPRWKVFHSTVNKKNVNALLRVRSKTYVGRSAGLMRFSEENSPLVSSSISFHNNNNHHMNMAYYVDQLKRMLYLIVYRVPRAIREWEIWITAVSYGLYYLLYYGNYDEKEAKPVSARKKMEQQFSKNRRVISSRNVYLEPNEQLANALQKQFDRIMSQPVLEPISEQSESSLLNS